MGLSGIGFGRVDLTAEGHAGEFRVDFPELGLGPVVMVADDDAHRDHRADDERRNPAALEKLFRQQHHQDDGADHETEPRAASLAEPVLSVAVAHPVDAQAEQRDGEGQEHADAVEHHQQRRNALGAVEDQQRRQPHHEDAVLGHQARRQVAELVRHPGIGRHVGEHRGAAQKAGVGGDEQQARLEGEHDEQRHLVGEGALPAEALDDGAEGDRVQRLPFDRLRVPQQVQQDDAAGGEGERQRHVEHGELAGVHARLGEHVDVVRHRFQPGVGAAALRVGEQQQRGDAGPADLARRAAWSRAACRARARAAPRRGRGCRRRSGTHG